MNQENHEPRIAQLEKKIDQMFEIQNRRIERINLNVDMIIKCMEAARKVHARNFKHLAMLTNLVAESPLVSNRVERQEMLRSAAELETSFEDFLASLPSHPPAVPPQAGS